MNQAQLEWFKAFKEIGALWFYNEEVGGAHALLTGGDHSDAFVDAGTLISRPAKLAVACAELMKNLPATMRLGSGVVVGSAFGAITLAYELARQLGAYQSAFTEPIYREGEIEAMVLRRFCLEKEVRVIVVEDVLTTGKTTLKTIKAVESGGGNVYEKILTLVNRSGMKELAGREIVSLLDLDLAEVTIHVWRADDCPLCRAGSKALRPKQNWAKLNGLV